METDLDQLLWRDAEDARVALDSLIGEGEFRRMREELARDAEEARAALDDLLRKSKEIDEYA